LTTPAAQTTAGPRTAPGRTAQSNLAPRTIATQPAARPQTGELRYEGNFFLTQLDRKTGAARLLPIRSAFAWGERNPYGEAVKHLVRLRPDREGYLNPFPDNVRLNKAWIENGVLLLDFNRAFEFNRFGHLGLQVQIQQVLWTVFDLSDRSGSMVPEKIDSVSILIEGKRKKTLGGEGLALKLFYGREDLLRLLASRDAGHA
jgi:spore germination protein GerM